MDVSDLVSFCERIHINILLSKDKRLISLKCSFGDYMYDVKFDNSELSSSYRQLLCLIRVAI